MRRALADEGLGNYSQCLNDLNQALAYNPSIAFQKDIIKIRSRIKTSMVTDDKIKQEEGVPDMFVTKYQSLRLNFGGDYPKDVIINKTIVNFRLYIGNEFGLWTRSNLNDSTNQNENNNENLNDESMSQITNKHNIRISCEVLHVLRDSTAPIPIASSSLTTTVLTNIREPNAQYTQYTVVEPASLHHLVQPVQDSIRVEIIEGDRIDVRGKVRDSLPTTCHLFYHKCIIYHTYPLFTFILRYPCIPWVYQYVYLHI